MGLEKSNAIQQKLKLGDRPYTTLRQMILPHAHMPCADKTRDFRKPHQPTLDKCHGDGVWAPLRDVFGRVTKSYLENLVELSPELMKVIEAGITCRATCGFDGVSEKNELQTVQNIC
mgnify:FL=1